MFCSCLVQWLQHSINVSPYAETAFVQFHFILQLVGEISNAGHRSLNKEDQNWVTFRQRLKNIMAHPKTATFYVVWKDAFLQIFFLKKDWIYWSLWKIKFSEVKFFYTLHTVNV